jgi:hypothetical protein
MAEPEVTVRMISAMAVAGVALAFGVAIGWCVRVGQSAAFNRQSMQN